MMKAHGFRLILTSLAVAVVAAFNCTAAKADIMFTSPFNGTSLDVNGIQFSPGNTLAVGGDNITVGSLVNTYYQANITSLTENGQPQFNTGPGPTNSGFFLTAVFGVTEEVTSISPPDANGNVTAHFGLAPNPTVNYFDIFNPNAAGDNHAGTGFNSGTLVLQGVFTNQGQGFSSEFTDNPSAGAAGQVPFDISNGGNSSGDSNAPTSGNSVGQTNPSTTPGGGSFQVTIRVDYANSAYWSGVNVPNVLTFVIPSGSVVDQFRNANPSEIFETGAGVAADGTPPIFSTYAPKLGTVNGLPNQANGSDFQFESDAAAVIAQVAVPEPATLTLLALGGLPILGLSIRRRSLARKAGK